MSLARLIVRFFKEIVQAVLFVPSADESSCGDGSRQRSIILAPTGGHGLTYILFKKSSSGSSTISRMSDWARDEDLGYDTESVY